MTKIYKHYLFILLLSIATGNLWAQIVPQIKENWVLDNNESSTSKSYIARESIKLQANVTNFSFSALTSGKSFSAKIDQTLVFPPSTNTYALPNGTITTDPAQGGVVGSIPGQFGVGPSGGASYSIPIECPSGINGMQPNVALVYNSQGGNGVAGWGWNISGMSAISRTGSNLYNDGKVTSPTLTSTDHLTLDGQRLILISGSNLVEGAIYRTEVESYSDITFKTINGSLCFEVKTKEGITMEFGSSTDSYFHAQGSTVAISWLLNKVTDANGNYMTYSYGNDSANEEFWLDKINYTYNAAAGITTGASEIDFIYSTGRIDSQTSYLVGKKLKQTLLLQSIVTKTNTETQREYTLSYTSDGFYTKLTSVNEKGNDGIKYNPTVIDWNKLNSTTTPAFGYNTSNTGVGEISRFSMDKTMIFVDLNNDGFVDMIRPTMGMLDYAVYTGWEIYQSINGQSFGSTPIQKENWIEDPNIRPFAGQYQLLPADINGDGMSDIVEIRNNINSCDIDVLLNVNGLLVRQNMAQHISGNASEKFSFELGDFNADGNTELLVKSTSTTNSIGMYSFNIANKSLDLISTTSNLSGDLSKSRTTDVNGNGISEIFTPSSPGKFLEYSNATNTFNEITFTHNLYPTIADLEFCDFNGDGKTDVLQYLSGATPKWTILISNGTSFETVSCPLTHTKSTDSGDFYTVKDINGDGKGDIIEVAKNTNTVNLYYYNGAGFISTSHTISGAGGFFNDRTLPYYDINGDGKSDIVNTTETSFSALSFTTPETERSVATITNGMNVKNTAVYKLLSDTTVYKNGTAIVAQPVVKLCIPMPVVSQTITSAGSTSDITNYSYKGLRLHTKGKGMLGFEEFTQDNTTQNKKSVTQFGYNTTYFNVYPTQQTVSTSAGQLMSTTTFVPGLTKLGLDSDHRYFPYTASQTTTDNLTGLTATSETLSFDDWGNPLSLKTTTGGVIETKSISYIQKASWCNNKVLSMTVSKLVTGENTYTRKTDYTYDDKGNLTKEIVDPTDLLNSVTSEYKYFDNLGNPDYFGHALQATATVNGIVRNTSSTYTASGRFIASKTNTLGEVTNYNWDENRGLLNYETNRYGKTSYTYNGFGSLIETKLPDGIRKTQVLQWAQPNNSIGAMYFAYTENSGNAPVTVWHDALGREIQKDSYGLNTKKISVTTEYYTSGLNNGRLLRVSEPYFEADAASKTWAQTYTYDGYGRPATLTTPMGSSSTAFVGKKTTVTTPEGTTETIVNDAGQTLTSKVNGKTVTYSYYASGLIKNTTPEGGQAIAMEYNLQGKRTKLTDPDAGIVETKYNGFGELIEEKQKVHNATNYITTTNTYDNNGLLQNIDRNGEITTYTYENQVKSRISTIEIVGKNKQTLTYDNFDRVTNLKEEIGTRIYNKLKEYDALGRVKKEIYPSGYYVLNTYDTYSNLTEVKDNANRSIWKVNTENARGQLTSINKGAKETTFGFDSRGLPTSIVAAGVENMAYLFDAKGNLRYRTDNITNQTDSLKYDGMNRLTNWNVYKNNLLAKQNSITFDATTSNITAKSDLGAFSMSYGGNRPDGTPIGPHALATISGVPANFPAADLFVTYTDFKKIATLKEGNKDYKLTYGVDDQRRKSEYSLNNTLQLTRYYLGDYEEEVNAAGNVRKIHYLSGAILIQNNGVDSLLYTYSDNQGSLLALTNEAGTVVEKYAYDPWGARRNPTDWTQKDLRTKWITNRGYTGHEHLDVFGIINMNGRVYDPLTAMFMSPDPQLQAPGDWLNYNRYGYCFGNPFKYTDPTGEWAFWDDVAALVIGGTINWVSNGCQFNLKGLSYFGAGAVAGITTLYAPGAAIAISGALGMTNSVIGQGFDQSGNKFSVKNVDFSLDGALGAGLMSAVTSYAGGALGNAMHLDKLVGGIDSPILKNLVGGMIGGTTIGGAFGGLAAVANGQDFGQGAWSGAKMGFISGSISGLGAGAQYSLKNKVNLFTGKPNPVMPKPNQNHHFATDKNKKYTPAMKEITDKYDLDLKDDWNKANLPHQGRHPNEYHNFVIEQMKIIDNMPNMNQGLFIEQFKINIRQPIINNPNMLYKDYWR